MAEVITDLLGRRLGRREHCRTRTFRLDGTPAEPWEQFAPLEVAFLRRCHGLDETTARHLVNRYGRRSREVAGYLEREPALARPVIAGEPDLLAEFAYQRDQEMALFPADHLLRRTRLGLFYPQLLQEQIARTG
jgi:glycerol-3-phosphate dehydrogenase